MNHSDVDAIAARLGSDAIWSSSCNPFRIGTKEWVWCSRNDPDARPVTTEDRIPLHTYQAIYTQGLPTRQPALRRTSLLLVNDWASIRRANLALSRSWRSPVSADFRPFACYYIAHHNEREWEVHDEPEYIEPYAP